MKHAKSTKESMYQIGDEDVICIKAGDFLKRPASGQKGICNGKTCYFHIGFGWITEEEWADLRQTDPRHAP